MTEDEMNEQEKIKSIANETTRIKLLKKHEYAYSWRRLMNADYFKYIKDLMVQDEE
jgi:hypothetical protein